jgi:PAS domain S-box-containing protein
MKESIPTMGNEHFRVILESLGDAFLTFDPDWRVVYGSSALARTIGISKDKFPGMNFWDVFPSAAGTYQEKNILEAAEGKIKEFEYHHEPTGQAFHVRAFPCAIGTTLYAFDITDRKKIEKDLQEKTHLLQSISDNMLDLVSLTDMKGTILFVSASHDILGYGHQTLIGKNVLDLVHPDDVAEITTVFGESIEKRDDTPKVEYRALCADGSHIWFETVGRFICNDTGKPAQIVFGSRDITERKQMESELQRLNEDLEQKVMERTKISEDRSIQLQNLAVQLIEAEEKERQRIAQLLHDDLQQLIASARMQVMAFQKIDPDPYLKNVLESLEMAFEKSRKLSYELSPPVLHQFGLVAALEWLIRYMEEQFGVTVKFHQEATHDIQGALKVFLFRAANELLFNSIKHSGVKNVALNLHNSGLFASLEISDQGKGFDPKILDATEMGMGLGLLSLRERARALGGKFDIESNPGQGSRFTLTVPVELDLQLLQTTGDLPASSVELKTQPVMAAAEKIRVLFVDDHKVMRQGLMSIMDNQPGIEVAGEAASGEQAIDLARQLRPDLIVMDISMPGMDGIEATRRIKAEMPDIRVIGLSMFNDESVFHQMIQAGADSFVNKGESSSKLLKAIYDMAD